MPPYEPLDFYRIDELLSPEERAVRDSVRRWTETEWVPHIDRFYLDDRFPMRFPRMAGEMGLLGCQLHGWGCPGLTYTSYGLVCQELERCDSSLRSFCSVQSSLVMHPIHRFGSDAQRERWLPLLARGEAIGCFGLTEPDHGSDPGRMATRAHDEGDRYRLSGAKMWITNGTIADVAVVWAKLDGVIRGFLVERGTPGFSAPEMTGKHSLRASVTSELILDDVRIPKENVLPGVQGLKGPLSCLTSARYGISWGALGAASACYHASRAYALSRTQFDRPLASFQLVQAKLARMLQEITKGQLLSWRLGRLMDEERASHEQVSLAKMNNVEAALHIARTARDLHGANGITAEYPVMRHMANLESVSTYEGTHDIHTLALGRWITGIGAFE